MSGRRGRVWFETAPVGNLVERDDGGLGFEYDAQWLRMGFAISLSVPLARGEHDARELFAGLLPEGLARQRVCRQYKLREEDDVGLLLAIGRDCAGALAVLPDEDTPLEHEPPVAITEDDLVRLVESQGQALPAAAARPRFSLAGAQHKLAVRIDDEGMWLPSWSRPSSHILKFETTRWACFAEHVANDIARRLGLSVPEVGYHLQPSDPPAPYLRIKRFDRQHDAGVLRRIHQEDVTQAMGVSRLLKYEEHGGPGLGAIATLLRQHSSDPIADIGRLRDWQSFNYLVGNWDGHAKNLALLYAPDPLVPRLAPFYDLVCIEFLNRLGMHYDRNLALFIGTTNVPERVTRDDWSAHAKAIGVPPKSLLETVRRMATDLPAMAAEARASFAERYGDNQAFDRLEESIVDRCAWTLRSVFGKG
jgi:serine/threonine-protein kinase HipA